MGIGINHTESGLGTILYFGEKHVYVGFFETKNHVFLVDSLFSK